MNVYEAIKARRSIRRYQSKPVEPDKLNRVLEAGRLAPSAKNFQEWRYIVVMEPGMRRKLAKAANMQKFVAEAPIVIVCCATKTDYVMRCGQPAYPIDVAISIDHMTLAAVEEGLGTCWIGAFYEDQVKPLLNIPHDIRVVELLTLGYPAENPDATSRLPMDQIVRYEKW